MGKQKIVLIFQLIILLFFFSSLAALPSRAGDKVEMQVEKIRKVLDRSLIGGVSRGELPPDKLWKKCYHAADGYIDRLKVMLRNGGRINDNPVKEHYEILERLLEVHREQYRIYLQAEKELKSLQEGHVKRSGQEIIGNLLEKLENAWDSQDSGEIREICRSLNTEQAGKEFSGLKALNAYLKKVEERKKALTVSFYAVRNRRNPSKKLAEKYASLQPGLGEFTRIRVRVTQVHLDQVEIKINGETITPKMKEKVLEIVLPMQVSLRVVDNFRKDIVKFREDAEKAREKSPNYAFRVESPAAGSGPEDSLTYSTYDGSTVYHKKILEESFQFTEPAPGDFARYFREDTMAPPIYWKGENLELIYSPPEPVPGQDIVFSFQGRIRYYFDRWVNNKKVIDGVTNRVGEGRLRLRVIK